MVPGNHSALQGSDEFAGAIEDAIRIDEDARAPQSLIVGFTHGGREGADEIHMSPSLEALAFEKRHFRHCRARDKIGLRHSRIEVLGRDRLDPFLLVMYPGAYQGFDIPGADYLM